MTDFSSTKHFRNYIPEIFVLLGMDIQASKIELAKLVLSIENPAILDRIKAIIVGEIESEQPLTSEETEEIRMAIELLDRGHRTSLEDFLKKVS